MKKKSRTNKKPVKNIKTPGKKKTLSLNARISELEDQLATLIARLDMAEAAIQVVKDAQEKQKTIPDTWRPAPSPFPAWPNQPPHMWNWCVKEEYDTHKNNNNKHKATT